MTHEEIIEARLAEISAHVASAVELLGVCALGIGVIAGICLVFAWLEGSKRGNVV